MIKNIQEEVFSFFPATLNEIRTESIMNKIESIQEIRIRLGQPLIIKCEEKEIFFKHIVTESEIIHLLEKFCHSSIYASQNEINQGYITLKGGHRVGISGMCVFENLQIKNVKEISSMNIRIAREVKGCSDNILSCITKQYPFDNTLLLSPPGCGKTTILRDMIRNLSNGFKKIKGQTVSLIDERLEIASVYKGVPQKDVGIRTDVMSNIPKAIGIKMMIRSMAPDIIATDEIGSKEDIEAINEAVHMGIKLLLTAHGNSLMDIPSVLTKQHLFKNIVILEKINKPGTIKSIHRWEDEKYVLCG